MTNYKTFINTLAKGTKTVMDQKVKRGLLPGVVDATVKNYYHEHECEEEREKLIELTIQLINDVSFLDRDKSQDDKPLTIDIDSEVKILPEDFEKHTGLTSDNLVEDCDVVYLYQHNKGGYPVWLCKKDGNYCYDDFFYTKKLKSKVEALIELEKFVREL